MDFRKDFLNLQVLHTNSRCCPSPAQPLNGMLAVFSPNGPPRGWEGELPAQEEPLLWLTMRPSGTDHHVGLCNRKLQNTLHFPSIYYKQVSKATVKPDQLELSHQLREAQILMWLLTAAVTASGPSPLHQHCFAKTVSFFLSGALPC